MTSPLVISVENASKKFKLKQESTLKDSLLGLFNRKSRANEDFWALKNVSVDIHAGETIGLIGHNGSGKSTLLKLIGGIIDPTIGSVKSRGKLAALLELGAGFHPDLTGKDNVFLNAALLGMSREETEERYDDIVAFAGIPDFMNTQVKFYSSGMFVRLAFSVAVHTDPDILIIDEVLAVGDEAFQWRCFEKINEFKNRGCTIVLVSHALDQVQQLCGRVLVLDHGVVVFDGKPTDAVKRFRKIQLDEMNSEQESSLSTETLFAFGEMALASSSNQSQIQPGEPWILQIELEARNSHNNINLAVSIETISGQDVSGFTSHGRELDLHIQSGMNKFEILFPDGIYLGGGHYYLAVMLLDEYGHLLQSAKHAVTVDVAHSPSTWGFVTARAEFRQI